MAVGQPRNTGAGRYSGVGGNSPTTPRTSWEDSDGEILWKAVCAVTDSGDAIMFSLTRDRGAVVLTVMSGNDREKFYATGETEIARLLLDVLTAARQDS